MLPGKIDIVTPFKENYSSPGIIPAGTIPYKDRIESRTPSSFNPLKKYFTPSKSGIKFFSGADPTKFLMYGAGALVAILILNQMRKK